MSAKCSVFPTLVKAQNSSLESPERVTSQLVTVLGNFWWARTSHLLAFFLSLPGPYGGGMGRGLRAGLEPCPSASEIPLWHICCTASGQAEGGQ